MNSRKLALAFGVVSLILIAISYFFPMWKFHLVAPQYPRGLNLVIYMQTVTGDVSEVDILNHYVGMGSMESAAKFERSIAAYAVGLMTLLTACAVFFRKKKFAPLLALPGIVFPLIFFAFFYYWLYSFGHNLDPVAPVEISPFTPAAIGRGTIGQFHTYGQPGLGFYFSLIGSILLALCMWLESRTRRFST